MDGSLGNITAYYIMNFLLPGGVSVWLCQNCLGINIGISNDKMFEKLMVYIFIGAVINRIGSFLETIFVKLGVFKKSNYKNFIKAEQKDKKLNLLVELCNSYRTFFAAFLTLLIYFICTNLCTLSNKVSILMLLIFLTITFFFSYKKQFFYINLRVNAHSNIEADDV